MNATTDKPASPALLEVLEVARSLLQEMERLVEGLNARLTDMEAVEAALREQA